MSFEDKKGIVVASGFKLQAETMLDARQQVDTIQERDELVTIHAATPGLRVYVKNVGKSYVYNGTSWEEVTMGAPYVHPTGDGNHHVPATGSSNNGKVLMAGATAGSEHWETLTKSDISDFPATMPTPNSLVVKLNGGTTEGTNQFTFNGSAAKNINITPAAIGAAASSHNHSAANITSGTLPVARGGTGITANPSLLVNLGSNSADTVFEETPRPGVTGTLPIANGGTGATSASAARSALGITPANIGASPTGHTHTSEEITDFDDAVDGLLPVELPNPEALTISLNGTSQGAYDGSAAKSINITPASIGASASGHTHNYAGSSSAGGAATSANKVNSSLVVKLNGGTTEGTNQFTFNGSAAKSINITPSSIGAAASSHTHSVASTSANGFLKQLNGSTSQFMRGDGSWATPPNTTYSNMKGATSSAAGAAGLVPAPAAGKQTSFLRGDGTWVVPTNTNTTYTLTKSGSTITLTGSDGSKTSVTDSNNTYSLSSFGITATAAELNYMDGVTSNVQTQLNGKAASSHTHNYAGSSSAGGAANSVKSSLVVKLNSGTKEGTNMFTFNGGTAKTINITPSSIGAAAASHGTHVSYSTSAPLAAGTASAGSASTVARSDHRHPLQTTVSGNAGSATKLATARTISLSGDATGSVAFNGTANVSIPVSVKNHTYIDIPSNSNLNSYTDPGWYRCSANATAKTVSNSPTDNAFVMIVNTHAGTNQIVIEYMTSAFHIWTRNYYSNTWGSWAEIYTTIQKPTASEIGAAASSHNHAASNITSGTLAVARGGTGITANPSLLVNLGSTAAAGVFATSPRPGVTGTLPVAHGGTGATSAAAARAALGAAAASHSHSYLPLSGGTVTGPITLSYAGCNGPWKNGKTNAKIIISDASATDGSKYSPIMMGKTAYGDVWNLGHGASDQVGFFGYYKERTENGTDWSHYIKVSDGTVHFGKTVYATTFSGPLSGNASSATTATNATSANKVNVPVGTVLFSTSSSATFFSSCFGGTWTVVGNVDAIVGSSSTLTLYMFRKTAA